jgi:hypothetical protein
MEALLCVCVLVPYNLNLSRKNGEFANSVCSEEIVCDGGGQFCEIKL